MNWQNPNILFLLWIVPLLAGLAIFSFRRRMLAARRFADDAMVVRLMPSFEGARPWLSLGVMLLGISLLIVAGGRPRFGEYFEKVTRRGVDLFVLIDVSRSMMAEDVSPSRLERAKSDVRDLLKKLPGDRVGLIVFAGKPAVKVPLTTDQGFYRTALDEVNSLSAPRGGTQIGDAVRLALGAMDERRDRDQVVVLITDGEDHDSFPREAATAAAERGVKIFTVGLGDPTEGARIPIRDESGNLVYLKHEGHEHWSKMDETLLQEMALYTKGAYIPAKTTVYDLGNVYEKHLRGLARGDIESEKRKRYKDRFQLFVSLGLLFYMVGMLIAPSRDKNGREARR